MEELRLQFGVSGMTIRRDLDVLEQANLVHRLRGSVIPVGSRLGDEAPPPAPPIVADEECSILADRPDVLILNPMDQRMARMIVQETTQRNTPIIAESIPFPGITTLIAIDSFRAGVSL